MYQIRRDVKITGDYVWCANAESSPCSRYGTRVIPGDMIQYWEEGGVSRTLRVGRIIGRIKGKQGAGTSENLLCVCTLSQDLRYAMERWIKPEEVERKIEPNMLLLRFLFGSGDVASVADDTDKSSFVNTPTEILRGWPSTGYATPMDHRVSRNVSDEGLASPLQLHQEEQARRKAIQDTWSKEFVDSMEHERESDGLIRLSSNTGGYPVLYACGDGETLCHECANEEEGVSMYWVFYEGPAETCVCCNKEITSAYGDPDEDGDGEEEYDPVKEAEFLKNDPYLNSVELEGEEN